MQLSLGSVYWLQARSQFRAWSKSLPGQADSPRHLLFVVLPDSWGQTAVAVSCPMLMAQSVLSSYSS